MFVGRKKYNKVLDENRELREVVNDLRGKLEGLEARLEKAEKRAEKLEKENAELRKQLEESQRAGKRQASPFSKGEPKKNPQKPGRKKGHKGTRRVEPRPEEVDETIEVPLPETCPQCDSSCGGLNRPEDEEVYQQFEQEIIFKIYTTQFNVHVGTCGECGCRIQGRHPEQISDALGAANVHLGPIAHALALELKNRLGVPFEKVADLYTNVFGLPVTKGGLSQARDRYAKKFAPSYLEIQRILQESAVVYMDETGWRLGGHPAWLWVCTNKWATLYFVIESRAHQVIQILLGDDFDGVLVSDCFSAYDPIECEKGKCAAHFQKAFKELQEQNPHRALEFPKEATEIFRQAIELKKRREEYSEHGYAVACGRIEARMDRLLARNFTNEGNRRLANRLRKHRKHLFTFLYNDQVEATNNRSERELKPPMATRKMSAGNRTFFGAMSFAIHSSVIQTCRRRGIDFIEAAKRILQFPGVSVIDFGVPPANRSP